MVSQFLLRKEKKKPARGFSHAFGIFTPRQHQTETNRNGLVKWSRTVVAASVNNVSQRQYSDRAWQQYGKAMRGNKCPPSPLNKAISSPPLCPYHRAGYIQCIQSYAYRVCQWYTLVCFLCYSAAAALPFWPLWPLCEHWAKLLSERQWGSDSVFVCVCVCTLFHLEIHVWLSSEGGDIMAKLSHGKHGHGGNPAPFINTRQLYLSEIAWWLYSCCHNKSYCLTYLFPLFPT